MTKQQCLKWVRKNRHLIKVSTLGKLAGISNLNHIESEHPDRNGYPATLPDAKVQGLAEQISKLREI